MTGISLRLRPGFVVLDGENAKDFSVCHLFARAIAGSGFSNPFFQPFRRPNLAYMGLERSNLQIDRAADVHIDVTLHARSDVHFAHFMGKETLLFELLEEIGLTAGWKDRVHGGCADRAVIGVIDAAHRCKHDGWVHGDDHFGAETANFAHEAAAQ